MKVGLLTFATQLVAFVTFVACEMRKYAKGEMRYFRKANITLDNVQLVKHFCLHCWVGGGA